jgi:signal transduction histidine kinase
VEGIIREAAAIVEPMVNNGPVHILREVAADIPAIDTDREKLRQIVLNLLDNAVKFTDQGEIKISAARHNGALKLAVSDTGIGISEEDLPRVFEDFYRGRSAVRGSGLGLAIVKRFVILLGGEIVVDSVLGKGSVFTVTLPVDQKAHTTA